MKVTPSVLNYMGVPAPYSVCTQIKGLACIRYSRLWLRSNIRRVRKMFCNTEISLKLHANHLRSPFALHKWFACSVNLLESGFELISQNILRILYRCSNAIAIDCIEYSLTFSWELIVEE